MKRKFYLKPAKRNIKTLLIILLFISFSCNKNKLNEDTAVTVYVEKTIVEEKYADQPDSLKFYKEKIFNANNTSENGLKEFMNDLGYKSDSWNRFFKKADEYLTKLKKDRIID